MKGDRRSLRDVQGQVNEVRFGPGMKQNQDGSWSPYLDPQGPQRFGGDGRIETVVGEELEVSTGSPRGIRASKLAEENKRLKMRAAEQKTRTDALEVTKADQSEVTELSSQVAAIESSKFTTAEANLSDLGLVKMSADPSDTEKGSMETLEDAIAAIENIRSVLNADLAARREAGQTGS